MAPRKLTPKTVTDTAGLLDEIRRARAQGYAINDEELELGLRSIAVPIRNSLGDMVAAMSLSVQVSRMGRARDGRETVAGAGNRPPHDFGHALAIAIRVWTQSAGNFAAPDAYRMRAGCVPDSSTHRSRHTNDHGDGRRP